jgi:hypothetical protein
LKNQNPYISNRLNKPYPRKKELKMKQADLDARRVPANWNVHANTGINLTATNMKSGEVFNGATGPTGG